MASFGPLLEFQKDQFVVGSAIWTNSYKFYKVVGFTKGNAPR